MKSLVLVLHDIRSCHNVGSILRTAEGLGVDHVYMTGYTPYPLQAGDTRLPHIARKLTAQIQKTALGAESSQEHSYHADVFTLLGELKKAGYTLAGLEQSPLSKPLHTVVAPVKTAVVLGREVEGIDPILIETLDELYEIPMYGSKESFNVVQAAAMALFQLRFH